MVERREQHGRIPVIPVSFYISWGNPKPTISTSTEFSYFSFRLNCEGEMPNCF